MSRQQMLRVSTGQNFWLSILAQEMLLVFLSHPYQDRLSDNQKSNQKENIEKFLSYLDKAQRGFIKSKESNSKNLAYDNIAKDELTAANEVFLTAGEDADISKVINELKTILSNIEKNKKVSHNKIKEWTLFLEKLSQYALIDLPNQEASHYI